MLTTHPAPVLVDTPPAEPDPLRVVVADDHPLYRGGIVRAREGSGAFEVVGEASDGATALALIRDLLPDVAVLDVRMPGLDGIDVVAALARHGPPVPVVLLSAFDDEALIASGLEAGAAAYVSKTADRDVICLDVAAAARARTTRSPTAIRGAADLGRSRMPGWAPRLTAHEHHLLQLAALGWEKPELALLSGITVPQLRRQLDGLLAKLGADDLREAVRVAQERHIIGSRPPPG
jgi:two-component system nitrate/nitrite response regulator NarL